MPHVTLISVVLDHLNTHTKAVLYAALPPKEAKRIVDTREFRFTPKHGSWLNRAGCAFTVLMRQCLNRRVATQDEVVREVAAWEQARNAAKGTVHWRFTTETERTKLRRLYPSEP